MSLFDPDPTLPLVRRDDRESAHEGARVAGQKMGAHKRMVIDLLGRQPPGQEFTARQIGEAAYQGGYITLHQIDTIRRRVHDLAIEGRLGWRDNGTEPLTFWYIATEWPEERRLPQMNATAQPPTPTPSNGPSRNVGAEAAAQAVCIALHAYLDNPDPDRWGTLMGHLEAWDEATDNTGDTE